MSKKKKGHGKSKFYDKNKDFGYIDDGTGNDVRYDSRVADGPVPQTNDRTYFEAELQTTKRGRVQWNATYVRLLLGACFVWGIALYLGSQLM